MRGIKLMGAVIACLFIMVLSTTALAQVLATINIDPDTLNLKSKGKWITCYIKIPDGIGVGPGDIAVSTVLLNGTVAAETAPTKSFDSDGDGSVDSLMVKFDRSAVQALLSPGDMVSVIVTGSIGGDTFSGSDTIRVIQPGT